jgi:short subunit dehydrogenase-like uncharacterized protein
MVLEAGLCLALDQEGGVSTIEPSISGGVLTPASALGMRLTKRLRAAEMCFEVLEGTQNSDKF